MLWSFLRLLFAKAWQALHCRACENKEWNGRKDKMMLEKESTKDKVKRKKAKILVVEDNPATRELFRELLSQQGYVVRVAQDGKEALPRVRKESFDLVDVKMPRMNGIQLLKELQKIIPHTKVVIVTATADLQIAVKAMKLEPMITSPNHFALIVSYKR